MIVTRLALLLATLIALSACNTVDGIGQDISGGANRMSNWF